MWFLRTNNCTVLVSVMWILCGVHSVRFRFRLLGSCSVRFSLVRISSDLVCSVRFQPHLWCVRVLWVVGAGALAQQGGSGMTGKETYGPATPAASGLSAFSLQVRKSVAKTIRNAGESHERISPFPDIA